MCSAVLFSLTSTSIHRLPPPTQALNLSSGQMSCAKPLDYSQPPTAAGVCLEQPWFPADRLRETKWFYSYTKPNIEHYLRRFPSLQTTPPAYFPTTMTTLTLVFASIMGLGPGELVIILVILLVLFGGSKLPQLAKGLGQSIKEFKKSSKEEDEEHKQPTSAPAPAPAAEVKKPEPVKTHGSN